MSSNPRWSGDWISRSFKRSRRHTELFPGEDLDEIPGRLKLLEDAVDQLIDEVGILRS